MRALSSVPSLAPLALVAVLGAAACDPTSAPAAPPPGEDAGASPNASILPGPRSEEGPAPLSSAADDEGDAGPRGMMADSAGRLVAVDAGPPIPLRPDRPLPLDPLAHGELAGVTLKMSLRWRDVPVPPKAPEVFAEGIAKAAAATALQLVVDLGEEGRTRIVLSSRSFPLPPRTEIRARDDRLGAVLLWPDGNRYRPIAAGALRTVFGERRADVTPLSPAQIEKDDPKAKPPKIDGLPDSLSARELRLESSFGTLTLTLAVIPDAGRAGAPLCRIFVELAGMEPTAAICKSTEVPLRASFGWKEGGGFDVEAKVYSRRSDLAPADMAVPPPNAIYTADDLPVVPIGVFLTKDDLAAFRSKPISVPLAADAPGEGFFAINDTDLLQYLLLDGVPVVAVPPHDKRFLVGPLPGTYMAQWRTFLGDHIEPAAPVNLPGVLRIGKRPDADAGN